MADAYPDRDRARRVFAAALAKARSGDALPAAWIEEVVRFGEMRTKGYLVALGTSLLAKATDARVDPLTLQSRAHVSPGRRAYSARTFCSLVLVKEGRATGVNLDLGLHGDEPLQGNPFTDEERLHRKLPVRYPSELDRLVSALENVEGMAREQAAEAFAAFLRVRTNVPLRRAIALPTAASSLPDLLSAVDQFAYAHSERGRVGQALTAAALEIVLDGVETTNVYASSKRRPGDVRARSATGIGLAAEVRQKIVDVEQVVAFVEALATAGIRRGIYAALAKGQADLPRTLITREAASRGVAFATYCSPAELVSAVASLAPDIDEFARLFPAGLMARMEELGVSEEARQAWADAVAPLRGQKLP